MSGERLGPLLVALAPGAVAALLLLGLAGCAADRIEKGVFHSVKGYQVSLPAEGWRVAPDGRGDLELKRLAPPGGMLADATCDGKAPGRPLRVLARHLLFGFAHRSELEEGPVVIAGRQGVRAVARGSLDGTEIGVEAVVLKDDRCVYDFLYVAPMEHFETGREDFKAFAGSFSVSPRRPDR